jgi:hypothetical protein
MNQLQTARAIRPKSQTVSPINGYRPLAKIDNLIVGLCTSCNRATAVRQTALYRGAKCLYCENRKWTKKQNAKLYSSILRECFDPATHNYSKADMFGPWILSPRSFVKYINSLPNAPFTNRDRRKVCLKRIDTDFRWAPGNAEWKEISK